MNFDIENFHQDFPAIWWRWKRKKIFQRKWKFSLLNQYFSQIFWERVNQIKILSKVKNRKMLIKNCVFSIFSRIHLQLDAVCPWDAVLLCNQCQRKCHGTSSIDCCCRWSSATVQPSSYQEFWIYWRFHISPHLVYSLFWDLELLPCSCSIIIYRYARILSNFYFFGMILKTVKATRINLAGLEK